MVFNATLKIISVISWRPVLLMEETGVLYHIMLYRVYLAMKQIIHNNIKIRQKTITVSGITFFVNADIPSLPENMRQMCMVIVAKINFGMLFCFCVIFLFGQLC